MSDALGRPRLDATVTFGNLLQVGTILAGIGVYLIAGNGKVDQTARELVELKTQVNAQASSTREQLQTQAADTRASVRESLGRLEGPLAAVNQQLMTLPPITERLRRAEADIARLDQRLEALRLEFQPRFTPPQQR